MRFEVLGPVQATVAGAALGLGAPRHCALLAYFLVNRDRLVTTDQIIEALWGPAAPSSAKAQVHNMLSHLRGVFRRHLPDDPIRTMPAGYRMKVPLGMLDLDVLEALADQEIDETDPMGVLRQALSLSKGETLAGVQAPFVLGARALLAEQQLAIYERIIERILDRGAHIGLVPELTMLVERHPLRERLRGQLMLALYRSGRSADALEVYRQLRRRLADELGVNPGEALRHLHVAILRDDPGLIQVPLQVKNRPVPAELPAEVTDFIGREAELKELDELASRDPDAMLVTAIAGTAGVGKTALALRWAHGVRDRFPDGQLYANLRGYDPGEPTPAAEILAAFLRSLGVDSTQIPPGADERAARFRTLLAGRRMLVFLDNAATSEQVRPLLPGSGSHLVIVTSRDALTGLTMRDGARRVQLGLFSPCEAGALLWTLLGGERVDAEPAAAAGLAERCARLPLALRVAAEHAASRPTEPLSKLLAELDRHGLDLLDRHGDEQTALRNAFSWSCRRLADPAARVFRLLGLHSGRLAGLPAISAMAGLPTAEADRALATLVRAHLSEEAPPGRFGMHDLLRAYAAELAATDPEPIRRAALGRMLDHYVHNTAAVKDILHPWDRPPARTLPGTAAHAIRFPDAAAAALWLETEMGNLAAASGYAADHGWPEHAWALSALLWRVLNIGNRHDEALAIHGNASRAARRHADLAQEARAQFRIGDVWWRVGRYDEATTRFENSLRLRRAAGDALGEAHTLGGLAVVHTLTGRHDEALETHRKALAIARKLASRDTEAVCLSSLGEVLERLGRYHESVEHHYQALAIQCEIGARDDEAWTLISLGLVHTRLGHFDHASEHYRRALALADELGARAIKATALTRLGTVLAQQGRHTEAIDHHHDALTLHREIDGQAGVADALHGLGLASHLLGEHDRAVSHLEQSLHLRKALKDRNGQAESMICLANALDATGHHEAAVELYSNALALAQEVGNRYERARAREGLARRVNR